MAANTEYRSGDGEHDLLRKILTVLGGLKLPGDSAHELLRKILSQLGSVDPSAGDSAGAAWFSSAGAPDVSLGDDGDYCLDTSSGDVYEKAAGAWTVAANIMGSTGPQGPEGPAGSGGRELLAADRTYYVATTGNDANDGLTALAPFATIQKAIDVVAGDLDLGGRAVTIQLADGTYAGVTLKSFWGGDTVTIRGNVATPGNVVIAKAGGSAVDYPAGGQGIWILSSVKLQTATSGHCLSVNPGSAVNITNLVFGLADGGWYHIACFGGTVTATGNYSVVGNAGRHIDCQAGGNVNIAGRTVTWYGPLNFSVQTVYAYGCGTVFAQGSIMTIAASVVTGTYYGAVANALIYTNGQSPNFFPGNAPGTTSSGGLYL